MKFVDNFLCLNIQVIKTLLTYVALLYRGYDLYLVILTVDEQYYIEVTFVELLFYYEIRSFSYKLGAVSFSASVW